MFWKDPTDFSLRINYHYVPYLISYLKFKGFWFLKVLLGHFFAREEPSSLTHQSSTDCPS